MDICSEDLSEYGDMGMHIGLRFRDWLLVPASLLFIICIQLFSKVLTASYGNWFGIFGMLLAAIAVYSNEDVQHVPVIIAVGIGFLFGVPALKVPMTAMPQTVGVFNAFGGFASAFASLATYFDVLSAFEPEEVSSRSCLDFDYTKHAIVFSTWLGILVGFVTFSGSVVAALKLQTILPSKPLGLPGKLRHFVNLLFAAAILACAILMHIAVENNDRELAYCVIGVAVLSLALGLTWVLYIGGGDMPVAIAVLNSLSGWATVMTGFSSRSAILVIAGALVGGSGAILSYVMCKAMNRSFANVIAGGFGDQGNSSGASSGAQADFEWKEVNVAEAADLLTEAKKICFVCGYGLAVAQAQGNLATLSYLLGRKDDETRVRFGVHPVAGRMPGHLSVLYAEAGIEYELVDDLEKCNAFLSDNCDLAVVIGANDIVNPAALDDPSLPIYGMPMLEVWKATTVIVMKRGRGKGYSGIQNKLFSLDNTYMLFDDAKKSLTALNAEVEQRGLVVSDESEESAPSEDAELQAAEEAEALLKKLKALPKLTYVGVLSEAGTENRVALNPEGVTKLREANFGVLMQQGCGNGAGYSDQMFASAGAELTSDRDELLSRCDVLVSVLAPEADVVRRFGQSSASAKPAKTKKKKKSSAARSRGKTLITLAQPWRNRGLLSTCASSGVALISLELVPRTLSKSQAVDVLSSQSSLIGYRAALEGATLCGRPFGGTVTASYSAKPLRFVVLGAGVAGLAGVGAAVSLGADVAAFDARTAAREQVESLRGKFIEVPVREDAEDKSGYAGETSEAYKLAQRKLVAAECAKADVVLTTALIRGGSLGAPMLIPTTTVRKMKPGSVIVDIAAEFGGNCELTKRGEMIVDEESGVIIVGYYDFASRIAKAASDAFSGNIVCLLTRELRGGESFNVEEVVAAKDEILAPMCIVLGGKVLGEYGMTEKEKKRKAKAEAAARAKAQASAAAQPASSTPTQKETTSSVVSSTPASRSKSHLILLVVVTIFALLIGLLLPFSYHSLILVFILATCLGYYLISGVTSALHTPLMSVTNAISGIVMLSGIQLAFRNQGEVSFWLALVAILAGSINISGGYLVTHRMLGFFLNKN